MTDNRWTALEKMSPEQRRVYFNKVRIPPKTPPQLQKHGGTGDRRMKENR